MDFLCVIAQNRIITHSKSGSHIGHKHGDPSAKTTTATIKKELRQWQDALQDTVTLKESLQDTVTFKDSLQDTVT